VQHAGWHANIISMDVQYGNVFTMAFHTNTHPSSTVLVTTGKCRSFARSISAVRLFWLVLFCISRAKWENIVSVVVYGKTS